MHKQGYVSLGFALCVALGVHSLIFLYISLTNHKPTPRNTAIQVVIIPQQAQTTLSQTKLLPKKQQQKLQKRHISELAARQIINATQHMPEPKKSPQTTARQHTNKTNNIQKQQQQKTVQILPVPHQVQQIILSHIHYPKQARRRGWQGKAEFQLDIRNKNVQQVTMLASTGYDSLDRAAKKGLASLEALPLNNGRYALAVVFQIQ